ILLKEGCFIGPQPMWRRCVHDVYGWFDENLVTSGDYEFWLRISQSFDFYHIRMPLGLYLARPDSIEHREIRAKRMEDLKIRSAYLDAAAAGITIRNITSLSSNPMIADTLRKNHKTTCSENTAKTPQGYRLNQIKSQPINQGGIDVKDFEIVYQAIQPLFNSSSIEDALAALENVVNSCPAFARAHHDLGSIYYQKNEKEKALAQFQLASRIEPQNAVFKKSLADFYYVEQNRIEEASRLYKEIVAVEPAEPETLLTAGHLCLALERFDEAKKNYERVLEVEPDNLDARQYLEKMQRTEKPSPDSTISEKGRSPALEPLNENLSRQDIAELEQKIRINPDDALAHNDLGVLYYRAGEKEKALKHYEQSAKLAPANIVFQKNLADFYFVEKGMIEEALKIYVNVLTIEPEDIETLQITGQICMSLHKFDDAKVFFNRVLEIEPWNFEAQELLDTLQALGQESIEEKTPDKIYREIQSEMEGKDPRTVIEALEKLAAAAPEFALAHNDLGVLYYQSGEKEKALTHYERAARLEPENATFQKNLADFYFVEQGRVEDALKIYVDLLAVDPEDVETLQITGHICVALHKFEDAKVFYRRILELEPWNADARQNLDKLDGFREAV
ncbi:MAG: tetratricopeptide repeat protein, partial [Desulfobacterales bacterium]